ncbi:MAG: BrnT family toxin [Cyclobacteriaceae bacterium]
MALFFEWDFVKAKANKEKHKITFEEASSVFGDENSLTIDDVTHSKDEKREITIGKSVNNHILVVVHTTRGKNIRIISARKANQKEKVQYINL